jgi:hypothetical protein
VIANFWKAMSEEYGYLFTSQYGLKPTYSWVEKLQSLSYEQLKNGYKAIKDMDEFIKHPPNPRQFASVALNKAKQWNGCINQNNPPQWLIEQHEKAAIENLGLENSKTGRDDFLKLKEKLKGVN